MIQLKALGMYYLLRMLFASCHFKITGLERLYAMSGKPPLMCFWHGDYVALLLLMEGKGGCIISSQSIRGNTIASMVKRFGYQSVLIPDKPSRQSMHDLLQALQSVSAAGTAVDGPLGPYRQVKGGVVWLAASLGMDLVPVALHCGRMLRFHQRWDHLGIPLPFSTINIQVGMPIKVPAKLSATQRLDIADTISEALLSLEQTAKQDTKEGQMNGQ